MEKFFRKKAFEFIHIASLGDSTLSALDFFDEKISPLIDLINENLHLEYIDAWFSILISEYKLIDEDMKKLVSLSIDDTDVFASSTSDVAYWESLKMVSNSLPNQ